MIAIEEAKCTLTFYPITHDDLGRMKLCSTENASTYVLLERALREFLDIKMSIPPSAISKMNISQIWQKEEADTLTVKFSSMDPVNTIFRYVKNLPPGEKVSISIPPVLQEKHRALQTQAFHLRNGKIRHKTVIKYMGNKLVLHVKRSDSRRWYPAPQLDPSQDSSLFSSRLSPISKN
jgi:hypothetical protein